MLHGLPLPVLRYEARQHVVLADRLELGGDVSDGDDHVAQIGGSGAAINYGRNHNRALEVGQGNLLVIGSARDSIRARAR